MRQRITFVHEPENGIDPETLQVTDDGISGPELPAVREERITIALDELPSDIASALKESHEIHVRWVSSLPQETMEPFSSRLPPGFHVFYTPQREGSSDLRKLCLFLEAFFGRLECKDRESFTELPGGRFSHSASLQYYELMDNLDLFIEVAEAKLCSNSDEDGCRTRVRNLSDAASLDISYDTISHALKITGLWRHATQSPQVASMAEHRTEVGIFATDPAAGEPHEIGIGGVLTVLGEQEKPSVHAFNIPTRHRQGDGAFSAKFLPPTGLHPTLQLRIDSRKPPALGHEQCALHAYFTLPNSIFADRYQLADDLVMASKNLSSLRYTSSPVDLERPQYRMAPWGSSILLELAPPGGATDTTDGVPWTAEVPLHLRYMKPSEDGYAESEIPYPTLFWACTAEDGTLFPNNPFERVNLGYDSLFGPRTVFWHLEPRPAPSVSSGRLTGILRVPVLQQGSDRLIEWGTGVSIAAGIAWIMICLLFVNWGTRGDAKDEAKETKKKQ